MSALTPALLSNVRLVRRLLSDSSDRVRRVLQPRHSEPRFRLDLRANTYDRPQVRCGHSNNGPFVRFYLVHGDHSHCAGIRRSSVKVRVC